MPLVEDGQTVTLRPNSRLKRSLTSPYLSATIPCICNQSQHRFIAQSTMISPTSTSFVASAQASNGAAPAKESRTSIKAGAQNHPALRQAPKQNFGHGPALSDTPVSTAPNSPRMYVYEFHILLIQAHAVFSFAASRIRCIHTA